jgi:RimJ/RimL family protein N-acetyltransferase
MTSPVSQTCGRSGADPDRPYYPAASAVANSPSHDLYTQQSNRVGGRSAPPAFACPRLAGGPAASFRGEVSGNHLAEWTAFSGRGNNGMKPHLRPCDNARRSPSAEWKAGMGLSLADTRIMSPRLVLRAYKVEDFDDYYAMLSDPEGFRYSERGPMTSEEAWSRLLRHVGHWALLGHGLFAVEERDTGRLIGEAGLGDFRRRLGADFDPYPEASWTVAGWAQGRGYATEAAGAALEWMNQHWQTQRTVCLIHAENRASNAVARKLGYMPYSEREYRGYSAVLFERN